MHRYLLTAASGGLMLAATLTGCSDPDPASVGVPVRAETSPPLVREETSTPPPPGAPIVTTTVPAPRSSPPPSPTATRGYDQFVARVREKLPEVVIDRRDEEVAALGEQTCTGVRKGRPDATTVGEIQRQGLTPAAARAVLALAKATACPA
ncbi:DUF732 domain-containing protein [Actinoplanes bogorensis]|uniref:DUF732 domain-containing protein n=1 Tax=Paractinoplanes bogorensis TaxID=1610840 RepID=A0ABS5Z0V1_9ACTN|nr:DUF732 domain-containing protein [Actinoplanes bogorensis]MBU2669278.1 DUF732 domain-containing protein [Actinoplanes bogorensis]